MINKPLGNKRRLQLLVILVLVQALFLCGIAGSYYAVGWFGHEIKIKTTPVDPRDLLYGDYVTLGYEISNLKSQMWKESGSKPDQGEQVYVALKPSASGIYEAVGVYRNMPALLPSEQAVLKGRVTSSWDESIRIQYGLERYYVPEGTGKELEQAASNMIVRVKIAPWGQMRISGMEAINQ
jgi:uncharacterized membrane-anchored protein